MSDNLKILKILAKRGVPVATEGLDYAEIPLIVTCGTPKANKTEHTPVESVEETFFACSDLSFLVVLKTANKEIRDMYGKSLGTVKIDYPLVFNHFGEAWQLRHPDHSPGSKESFLNVKISRTDIMPSDINVMHMHAVATSAYTILSAVFAKLNIVLTDTAFEFGVCPDGKLFITKVTNKNITANLVSKISLLDVEETDNELVEIK